jgi:hypothetical protein
MAAHRTPKRAFWQRKRVRALVVLTAIIAVFATAAGVAFAYWTAPGSGTSAATTGTLNPPTGVTGAQTPGTGSVDVSWSAPATGATPSGYYVTRTDAGDNTVAACGTSASTTTASTSCTDTSVPLGSYTYTVVAVFHSWTATSAPSATVTVAQAAQSISFTSTAPANAVVNGPTYTVTATGGGSGNPVTFSAATPGVCTVVGSTVSFQHAGTCTVNADQAGDTYYASAPTLPQSFTVGKASQTISFTSTAPSNAVVAGPTYTVTATGGASGNPVVFSIDAVSASLCSIAGSIVSFQHVGTCVIDANQAGNADYLAANQVQQSIAVGKGSQAITFTSTPPSPAPVGGSYTPTATSTSGLPVTITLDGASTGCTLTSGTVNFTGAGTCRIDANQAGNADYLDAAQMQQQITISKLNQSITFTSTQPANAKFGGSYSVSATAISGLPVSFGTSTPGVCTASGATITFVGTGNCIVTADQAGNGTYNAAPQQTQTFTVGKADQTVSFTSTAPSGATVGGATYTATASATSGLGAAIASSTTSVCTGSGTNSATITFVGPGNCILTANQAGNANWNAATQATQSFTVSGGATKFAVTAGATQTAGTPFTVTITAQDASNNTVASYTGNHNITLTSTAGASLDGTTPTLPSGNLNFVGGVATVNVTLVKAESNRTVTASDSTITGTSGNITVNAGAADSIIISNATNKVGAITPTCTRSGTAWTCDALGNTSGNTRAFTAQISLVDSFGNVRTNTGSAIAVSLSGSPSPTPSSVSIANGASSSAQFTVPLANGSSSGTYSA